MSDAFEELPGHWARTLLPIHHEELLVVVNLRQHTPANQRLRHRPPCKRGIGVRHAFWSASDLVSSSTTSPVLSMNSLMSFAGTLVILWIFALRSVAVLAGSTHKKVVVICRLTRT